MASQPQMVMVPAHTHYSNQPQYAVQPGPTQAMSTDPRIGGNRNALNLRTSSSGRRGWSHGACGCCAALPTCLFAWCCPCFSYAKIQSRFDHLVHQGSPHPSGGNCCTGDCCTYGLLMFLGCPCFVAMGGRKNIRNRYNIEGGCCSDFCCTCLCIPCALTQESREVSLEEKSFRR